MLDGTHDLVDRIYEAAVLPELWPSVLADLAQFGGADAGVLITADLDSSRLVTSPDFDEVILAYINERWGERTDRTARLVAKQHAGFVTDLDIYTPAEFAAEPVFREFFNPRGFGTGVATIVSVPTGDKLMFDFERATKRGPIPRECVSLLDGVRPHLARAATMSARLRLQTVRAAAQALDMVGLPAAVLGPRGRLLTMNHKCEGLLRGVIREGPHLTLVDRAADQLLKQAISGLSSGANAAAQSIPLAAREDQPPTVLHLLPIRRAAADLFVAAEVIAVFTPLTSKHVPGASVLEGLFDLTAAEARVARGIASGRTVNELSVQFGTSDQTVRAQLKAVMHKTGTGRQVELVRLLVGDTLPLA